MGTCFQRRLKKRVVESAVCRRWRWLNDLSNVVPVVASPFVQNAGKDIRWMTDLCV